MTGTTDARRWLGDRIPFRLTGPEPDDATVARAGEPHRHGDLDGVVAAVARALRTLHDLDPAAAPLPTGWDDLERTIELEGIETLEPPVELAAPYDRYSLADLRSIWVGGRPATEDLVVCHGRATLDRFWVATEPNSDGRVEVTALGDAERFRVADRHLDLAVVQQSLLAVYGFEAVVLFYEHYGTDPDMLRLDHYVLAGLLLDGPITSASDG